MVEPIDPVFALSLAAVLWSALFIHTALVGKRRRARQHFLNSKDS